MLLIATPSFAMQKFKPYTKEITNNKLRTITIEKNNIEIVRNKYELKEKASEMASGYEFLITNKTNKPIILKELGSLGALGRLENDIKILADFGPENFIPVYNIFKSVQTNKESSKFTKPFPFDYEITPNSTIQITVLSDINEIPIVEFQFLIDNKPQTITFGKDGYSNQEISKMKEYYLSQIDSYYLFRKTGSLGVCIKAGDAHLVNSYIKSGININQKFMGLYPTNYAVVNNKPEILKMLLEAGADPNAEFGKNQLLVYAILKKSPEMTKLLIDNGAKVNGYTGKRTPLNLAIYLKQPEIVKILINAGADVNEYTIKFANKSKNEDIKNLILSKSK